MPIEGRRRGGAGACRGQLHPSKVLSVIYFALSVSKSFSFSKLLSILPACSSIIPKYYCNASMLKVQLKMATFNGGGRNMKKKYYGATALVQKYGRPNIFLTMTCNLNWDEITIELKPGQTSQD